MVNFCTVCGCCTRTDIVREHLEGTLRICDVSAMGLYGEVRLIFIKAVFIMPFVRYLVFYCPETNFKTLHKNLKISLKFQLFN